MGLGQVRPAKLVKPSKQANILYNEIDEPEQLTRVNPAWNVLVRGDLSRLGFNSILSTERVGFGSQ